MSIPLASGRCIVQSQHVPESRHEASVYARDAAACRQAFFTAAICTRQPPVWFSCRNLPCMFVSCIAELEATYSPVKYDETAATTATATSIATAPSPCSSSDMRIRHSQAPAATRCLWKSCSLTPLAIERNEEKGDGTTARSCWPSSHSRSTSFVSQWSPSSTSSHEVTAL